MGISVRTPRSLVAYENMTETIEADSQEKKWLKLLSVCLGFGQGCGLCFFVGAGGYYAALFDNKRFFIYYCAWFYIPPIVISITAVLFDRTFDVRHGVRVTSKFRIFFSGFGVTALLIIICIISTANRMPFKVGKAYGGEGALIYGFGSLLGIFCSILISATVAFLGTIEAGMVPLAILGQTAAGVFTNLVAKLIGFAPGAEEWRLQAYLIIASASVLTATCIFAAFNRKGVLERSYQYHEQIIASLSSPDLIQSSSDVSELESCLRSGQASQCCPLSVEPTALQLESSISGISTGSAVSKFPLVCWSMAACQCLAIAMNMSLTPLANQVAHGSYDVTQALVLTKLLSDFVGRVVFFLLPRPLRGARAWSLTSVKMHAFSVWLVELIRVPLWAAVYSRARHIRLGSWTDSLSNEAVLLWLVWLPLISLGAMSSSWCCVVAVTAASEQQRTPTNVLMATSLYAGFSVGISIALLS